MIAIFGGSFDPVHYGHIYNMQLAYTELDLKKLIILPCGNPAHKDNLLFNKIQRLELLKLGLKDYKYLTIDTFEFNNKTNYTIDTLKYFKKKYNYINFIMGTDSFLDLHNWEEYERFSDLTNIIIVNRGNKINNFYNFKQVDNKLGLENTTGKVFFLQDKVVDISSTKVREKIRNKQNLENDLPPQVINKINEYTR